jgi:hypothetical protein
VLHRLGDPYWGRGERGRAREPRCSDEGDRGHPGSTTKTGLMLHAKPDPQNSGPLLVPAPSCPFTLYPQHAICPPERIEQLDPPPAATDDAPEIPGTRVGLLLQVSSPSSPLHSSGPELSSSPSSPWPLSPQHTTEAEERRAHVCCHPAATWVASVIPSTGAGDARSLDVPSPSCP